MAKGKSRGERNSDRPNGKAWKKRKKTPKKTGRTTNGYLPKKLAIRAEKRKQKTEA